MFRVLLAPFARESYDACYPPATQPHLIVVDLTGRLRRSWGVAAVRAAAHLRVSRLPFVGMPAAVVRGLRRATRAPYRGPVSPRVYREGLRPDLGARRVVRG